MVVARCEPDGSLTCQNSWGCAAKPLFNVRPESFVAAFAVGVEIIDQHVSGNATPSSPPPELPEWEHMWSPLPRALLDLDRSEVDSEESDDTIECDQCIA